MIRESVNHNAENRVHCGLEDCKMAEYVRYIALLARSHRRDKPGILAREFDDDILMTGVRIRLRLLVALLRLADELERDYMRVDLDELKLWDIPLDSKVHWWIHHYTRGMDIRDGRIRARYRVPLKCKDNGLDRLIFDETLDSIEKQFSEVETELWKHGIHLKLEKGDPGQDHLNYVSEGSIQDLPDDVAAHIREKFGMIKKGEEAGATTRAAYWLDGIPGSDDEELKRLTDEGLSHVRREEHGQAIVLLKQALAHAQAPSERAALKLTVGNSLFRTGRLGEALECYNDALTMFQALETVEARRGTASALHNIGSVHVVKVDTATALEKLQAAHEIHREIGYPKGEVRNLRSIGLVYMVKDDTATALKKLQAALEIDREIGNRLGEAETLAHIGQVYMVKDDTATALEHFQAALKIDQEIGCSIEEVTDLNNIGLVYRAKRDTATALKNLQAALKIAREIGYGPGEAIALSSIGLVYRAQGDSEKALENLQAALVILDKHGLMHGRGVVTQAIESIQKEKETGPESGE